MNIFYNAGENKNKNVVLKGKLYTYIIVNDFFFSFLTSIFFKSLERYSKKNLFSTNQYIDKADTYKNKIQYKILPIENSAHDIEYHF